MERGRLRRFGQWIVFTHLLASPLVFTRLTTESFELPKVLLLLGAATLLGGLGLAGLWPTPPRTAGRHSVLERVRLDPVGAAVMLLTASAVASTVASISPLTSWNGAHESFAGLTTVLAYAVLFFATRSFFADARGLARLLWAPTVAAGAAAAYGLVQLAGLDPFEWGQVASFGGERRVFGTLGHPNLLGGYLAVCLPLAAFQCRRASKVRRWPLVVVSAAVTGIAAIVVVGTFSRAAWLALGLAVLLGLLRLRTATGRPHGLRIATAAALVCLGALFLSPLGTRVRERIEPSAVTRNPRVQIWTAALSLWRDHPVLGSGLDTFGLTFPRYRTPEYALKEWGYAPLKAHNEVLQVLATQGLVGLAGLATLVGALTVAWRRAWRRPAADRPLLTAVAASLAASVPVLLFGFMGAALGTLLVTLAALVSQLANPNASEPGPERYGSTAASWVRAAAAIVVVGLLSHRLVYRPLVADVLCHGGLSLASIDPSRALTNLREAAALEPTRDLYPLHLAATAHRAARRQADPATRRRLLEEARASCERALALVPVRAEHHANLGRVLGDLARQAPPGSEPAAVYAAFEAAIGLDPSNAALYTDASGLALGFGERERARDWSERCSRLYPDLGLSLQYLGQVALRRAVETNDGADARARLGTDAVSLLSRSVDGAWHGDEAARALAWSDLSAALLLEGRPEQARAAAAAALERLPHSVEARFNLARSYELLGDRNRAASGYRSLLAERPDFVPARQALGSLKPDP